MSGSRANTPDRDARDEWSIGWIGEPTPIEQRIRDLFLEGVSQDSGSRGGTGALSALADRRAELIARLSDPDQRARLQALFEAHDALPPEPPRAPPEPPDPSRLIGLTLGEFTVKSLLASGGSADVYLAQQRSPQREVVLKVRRARHGTDGQVRRFLAEAEQLAGFSHPGVAHVYGSGVGRTDTGPIAWIAMERVSGVDLAAWRRSSERSSADRCGMLAQVAEIVAAAHAAGIVHRDLAPRNITVSPSGMPRVIDYGISRTLHSLTEHPSIEGTPGFASPEQRRGAPASTGDDVYALGRLLEWIAPDGPDSAQWLVRQATGVEAARPTAAQFASRLAAVSAPPDRRKAAAWLVASATCVAGAVMLGSPAARQRVGLDGAAGSGAAVRTSATPIAAEVAAASADAVDRILTALLESASPSKGGTSRTTVLEATARAEQQIMAESSAPARVRRRALERLSNLWSDFGDYERAARCARAAAEIADADPDASPLLGERLRALSAVLMARLDDLPAARSAVVASVRELSGAGALIGDGAIAPPDAAARQLHMDYAQAHVYLALAAKLNGDLALARTLSDVALPHHRSGVLAGTRSAVTFLMNRAKLEQAMGDLDSAVELAGESVAVSESAEADSALDQLDTRALHAGILEAAGQLGQAAAVYRQVLDTWMRIDGPNHPKAITALNNLGLNLVRQGKADEAVPLLEDACRRSIAIHGAGHQHTIDNHGNLARAYDGAGRIEDAAAVLERYLPVIRSSLGSPSVDEVAWLRVLADIRTRQQRPDEARALLHQVIATGQNLSAAKGDVRDARKALEDLGTPPHNSRAAP